MEFNCYKWHVFLNVTDYLEASRQFVPLHKLHTFLLHAVTPVKCSPASCGTCQIVFCMSSHLSKVFLHTVVLVQCSSACHDTCQILFCMPSYLSNNLMHAITTVKYLSACCGSCRTFFSMPWHLSEVFLRAVALVNSCCCELWHMSKIDKCPARDGSQWPSVSQAVRMATGSP